MYYLKKDIKETFYPCYPYTCLYAWVCVSVCVKEWDERAQDAG